MGPTADRASEFFNVWYARPCSVSVFIQTCCSRIGVRQAIRIAKSDLLSSPPNASRCTKIQKEKPCRVRWFATLRLGTLGKDLLLVLCTPTYSHPSFLRDPILPIKRPFHFPILQAFSCILNRCMGAGRQRQGPRSRSTVNETNSLLILYCTYQPNRQIS